MRTADFFYLLPDEAIAQQPVEPRDAARLLDTRDMTDHTFRDLAALLAPGDLVVVEGALTVDKDFGAGYVYDAIIEKAKVTKE